jgi:hypothetical protein
VFRHCRNWTLAGSRSPAQHPGKLWRRNRPSAIRSQPERDPVFP